MSIKYVVTSNLDWLFCKFVPYFEGLKHNNFIRIFQVFAYIAYISPDSSWAKTK
jgi:hypothetical protein